MCVRERDIEAERVHVLVNYWSVEVVMKLPHAGTIVVYNVI